MHYLPFCCAFFYLFQLVEVAKAFALFNFGRTGINSVVYGLPSSVSGDNNNNDIQVKNTVDDEFDKERKAELFQFLLRDLEVEGVPLLGCDVVDQRTFQAATWSITGQLSENDVESKACMIFEDIPIDDLKTFVDSISVIKTQQRLMDHLQEIQRLSFSLVGKGIGPAMIVETQNRTKTEKATYNYRKENSLMPNEVQWTAAMKSFVERTNLDGCDDPIAYRFVGSSDVCDIFSAYWNCICELMVVDETEIRSIVLSFPPATVDDEHSMKETHDRFAAIAEFINIMHSNYKSEDTFELVHLHPTYDRDAIHQQDEQVNGHLPPTGWLRSMMGQSGYNEAAYTLSDEQLTLQNYQRRSPLPAVIIKRTSVRNSLMKVHVFSFLPNVPTV